MKNFPKWLCGPVLAMLVAGFQAFAQSPEDARHRPAYSQAELGQMVAPVALYPDALLSQLLMAATYPLEIVQAARWSRANPNLHGEEAVRAVADFDWDPSVKSLAAFPRLLRQMDERLDWTERLGNALLGQEHDLMRAVQRLRWHAYAAGNLRSSGELTVRLEGTDVYLEAPPAVVHVPYYDPRVAFGAWEWPRHEPVHWSPWPDYSWHPGSPGFGWTAGIPVSTAFFFGTCDWAGRHVRHGHHRPFYYRDIHRWQRAGLWRHDSGHRRGVAYRNVDPRHQLHRVERVDLRNRAPQPGAAIPRADVRAGGALSRPAGITRPLEAVPQAAAPVYEPSPLARPAAVPQPRPAPQPRSIPQPAPAASPAPAPALARPEAPGAPPQSQPANALERGDLRRRER